MLETLELDEDKIQELLSDKYIKIILESIKKLPKSTSQLCMECKIPPSTTYRKMQKLYSYRVIRRIGIINEAGKREAFYKSNIGFLKILKREGFC